MEKSQRIKELKKLSNTPAKEYFDSEYINEKGFAIDPFLSAKKSMFETLVNNEKVEETSKELNENTTGVTVITVIPDPISKAYYATTEEEVNRIIKKYIESIKEN